MVIAHEPDGLACQIERRLSERGFSVDTHVVTHDYGEPNVAAPWPSVDGYDLIVPMGSIRSLTKKYEISEWVYAELDLLRSAYEASTPILGVCFGGQLLADALGGSVELAPVTEIGWSEIRPIAGADNPVGAGPWKVWHHDRFTPPPGADILAETDHALQLFRIGRSVGTQFHPEVDVAHIANWLGACEDSYLSQHGVDRDDLLAAVREHEEHNAKQCDALVDWFLDEIAFPEGATTK